MKPREASEGWKSSTPTLPGGPICPSEGSRISKFTSEKMWHIRLRPTWSLPLASPFGKRAEREASSSVALPMLPAATITWRARISRVAPSLAR